MDSLLRLRKRKSASTGQKVNQKVVEVKQVLLRQL